MSAPALILVLPLALPLVFDCARRRSALVPGSHTKVKEIEAVRERNWVGEGQERKWVGEGSRFIEPFTAVSAMMLSSSVFAGWRPCR